MHAAGFALDNVLDGLTASAAAFKGKKSIRAYAGAGRLFIRYLQDRETLPRSAPPPTTSSRTKTPVLKQRTPGFLALAEPIPPSSPPS
jgi:hypothetical protein